VKRFLPLSLATSAFLLLLSTPALADDSSKQQSVLDPAGPSAQHISDLWWIISIPALIVTVLVGGAILYACFHFRRKSDDDPLPRQVGGNNALEFTWSLVPALVLLSIFVLTVFQMPFIRNTPASAQGAMTVKVNGRQWAWSFSYPNVKAVKIGQKVTIDGTQYTTASNDLVIPAGAVVSLDIVSTDVIHSWSIPRLQGRIDAIPGQTNHSWIEANSPGAYYGQCSEFCGLSHAAMTARVLALPQADWDSWYSKQVGGP
jgi:cytochrome c oxidase subunit 2